MPQYVLVTLDLPSSTDEQRAAFYEYLKSNNWTKLAGLTTAWKVTYKTDLRLNAGNAVTKRLAEAKKHSKVPKVVYAFQLDPDPVVGPHELG